MSKSRHFFGQAIHGQLIMGSPLQQVGAKSARAFKTLIQFPFFDFGIVPREQDFGHLPAFVVRGSCIDRRSQESVLEGVAQCALLIAQHARHHSHDGIADDGGGQFPAGQHVVSHADFAGDEMFADAIVNAFVVSTENDEILRHGQRVGERLVKLFTVGRGEDDFIIVSLRFERGDAVVNRLALHDHAGEAAEGVVIDAAVFVVGVVTKVVKMYFNQPAALRTGKDGGADKTLQHFGENGDDVYSHE